MAPISLYYKPSFIYDLLSIHPEATISVVEKITDPLGFRKNSCNEHLGKIPKKPTHFGVLNSSTFAGLLGVRKTSRLERFMYVLDVKRKACLRNFRHVQRCAYPEYALFWSDICVAHWKNDKYIKGSIRSAKPWINS